MPNKRDRDFNFDELTEAARGSSIPRHVSATSISDSSLPSELQTLRLLVQQLQQDLQLKEQELALQLQKNEQQRMKNEHELNLRLNQEQQLRLLS